MKIIRVSYFALTAFAFAASCSKEAAEPNVFDWNDGKIYIKPSIANVAASRAQDMTLDRLGSFQVTCFNSADTLVDKDGHFLPYFENATFIRQPNLTYTSDPREDRREWPANSGVLTFFAFSPSRSVMQSGDLINTSVKVVGSKDDVSFRYSLPNLRINPDISHQFDFITAEASGVKRDFIGGVDLAFGHRLCQVEIQAWGNASVYNFDIAGVRIGNPVVEGTFVFAGGVQNPAWVLDGDGIKEKVEYCYGESKEPDKIFRINGKEHNSPQSAASIMGQGGAAMVIPTFNSKWEGLNDPNIGATDYKTDRMYFSILIRVSEPESGMVVYPYPGNPNGMKVISYAVDASGNIITRLYAGEKEGEYFLDQRLKTPYLAKAGEEAMDFGWAAVPVDADWKAGKKYVYTLDYSEGIGLHDPEDPEPGKPIRGQSEISWGVVVDEWDYAEPDNDNFTPDIDAP